MEVVGPVATKRIRQGRLPTPGFTALNLNLMSSPRRTFSVAAFLLDVFFSLSSFSFFSSNIGSTITVDSTMGYCTAALRWSFDRAKS